MMKPIKTEYRGIIFDSKSEAVFARTLDLANLQWGYHYQPKYYGREWDFLVHGRRIPKTLIEYKPSMPTWTYINNLIDSMKEHPKESVLIWGNPWNGIVNTDGPSDCCYYVYPIFSSFGKYGWGDFCTLADSGSECPVSYRHPIDEMFDITEDIVQEAWGYRFDLVHDQDEIFKNFTEAVMNRNL